MDLGLFISLQTVFYALKYKRINPKKIYIALGSKLKNYALPSDKTASFKRSAAIFVFSISPKAVSLK